MLEKETLDLTLIIQILGDRPFPPRSNFKEYLETKKIIDKEKEEVEQNNKEPAAAHAEQIQIKAFEI